MAKFTLLKLKREPINYVLEFCPCRVQDAVLSFSYSDLSVKQVISKNLITLFSHHMTSVSLSAFIPSFRHIFLDVSSGSAFVDKTLFSSNHLRAFCVQTLPDNGVSAWSVMTSPIALCQC